MDTYKLMGVNMAGKHSENTIKTLELIGKVIHPIDSNFIAKAFGVKKNVARSLVSNAYLRGELIRERYGRTFLYKLSALGHAIVFNETPVEDEKSDVLPSLLFFYKNTEIRCKSWQC